MTARCCPRSAGRRAGQAGGPAGGPAGGRDAGPAASPGDCPATGPGGAPAAGRGGAGGGLDAGFLSRDPVPGQPPRSGFSSGGGCDTAVPGPALARSLQAATGAGGHGGLDDDELIGVLAGWAKTEAWAAAGRLAAAAELAARRPAGTRAAAAARAGQPAAWSKYCADELAVALSSVPAGRRADDPAGA